MEMSNQTTSAKPRTISVVDEDELQIHKLYRERIVQEDNIINHRMMWLVLTQAFLLGIFGALAQKIYAQSPENLFTAARVVCATGIVLAVGSKFAIRAAQDEIDELREKYLKMYPSNQGDIILTRHAEFWINLIDMRLNKQTEKYPHVETLKERGSVYLPDVTGSRNFHLFGHAMPKAVPGILILLWVFLFFNVKRDIPHLLEKHWPTYVLTAFGFGLAMWIIPKAAEKLKDRATDKNGHENSEKGR